jgi:hypothetical protein
MAGESKETKTQGNPNNQLLTYAAIGIVCIVIGFFLSSGFGSPKATATITTTPVPSPSLAAPTPSPQAPTPQPSAVAAQPTPAATATPSIDDIGPAVEAAANRALTARNASKGITLDRLTYNVGPLTNPSRTYYQGEVLTVVQNGSSSINVNLAITVYDVLKGESNPHPVSASSVLDINGRKVSVSGSYADFEASVPCLNASIYVYAKETGMTFTPRELFEQIVTACPA